MKKLLLGVGLAVSLASGGLPGSLGAESLNTPAVPPPEGVGPQIVEGSKVTLLYVISVPGYIDSDVSEFVQGEHEIFPALEQVIVGMKPQEEKEVELSPAEGFGVHDDRKKVNVPKTLLPPEAKEGDVLHNANGDLATVEHVTGTMVVLDYNHPLAGKPLMVRLKVLKVENP
ncbi:MAG TPA: FKBP-type peptidyl-prolyl cis-trans isomerase [Nitrospiraceae bacterium]|nr:FKBP-type peptidyl-prolyl cis-trans isomerase [Nitrospiraceae bacterium]